MATWQFDLHLIPKKRILDEFGEVTAVLKIHDRNYWTDWKSFHLGWNRVKSRLGIEDENLLAADSWTAFGKEDENCLQIVVKNDEVSEFLVRIDTREYNGEFLERIIEAAELLGAVFLTPEMHVIDSDLRRLSNHLKNSKEPLFSRDFVACIQMYVPLREKYSARREAEEEIDQAVIKLALNPESFLKCSESLSTEIYTAALEALVEGSPRVWWLNFRHPHSAYFYPNNDGHEHLLEYIPSPKDKCWLIPEVDKEEPLVYDVLPGCLEEVLSECIPFEYNIVGKNFDWVVTENDHSEIIVSQKIEKAANEA